MKAKKSVKVSAAQRREVIETLTLEEVLKTAQEKGVKLTVSLSPPDDFKNDSHEVKFLASESVRHNERASNLRLSQGTAFNHKAYAMETEMGWAYDLAAATLRCYLRGELETKPPAPSTVQGPQAQLSSEGVIV